MQTGIAGVSDAGRQQLRAVLQAAARLLPAAQQCLEVHDAQEALPALYIATGTTEQVRRRVVTSPLLMYLPLRCSKRTSV